MKRFFVVLMVVALVGAGGWYIYDRYIAPVQAQSNTPTYETFVVQRGSIASTVSATGSIEPNNQVSLVFRNIGTVNEVLVEVGQPVQRGQLLAQLDVTDLTLALANAKVSQEIAAAQLAKLEAPPDPMDVAAAQAAVEVAQAGVASAEAALASAQAAYRNLFAGPSEAQQVINEAQLRQAEIALKQAQQAYNKIRDLPDAGMYPQAQQLEQATANYELAKAQVAKTTEPVSEAQRAQALNQIAQAQSAIRQAQAQVVNARNNLNKLLEGPKEEDLTIARAQLKQAQLNVLQAENALANARLIAPIDGVVSQVNIKAGEIANNARPAIVLTDLSRFKMKVLVDEIDVRQVAVGQPVRLSVDALPGAEITGKVTEISPTASNVGGVVAYEVTVVPDPTEEPLRVGMSATAIITTANVDDVVLAPNRFITIDRTTGEAYVFKMVNGEPVRQRVELGLRNERESQILAGLQEGDQIALVTQTSEERLRGALFGGN
uniref:Efflux RND transporter periplasmic adaptor subunit n=1 Tax=Caldilinea aerophila TaxID=133453 RepID=A0A7C1JXA8_9CHLR